MSKKKAIAAAAVEVLAIGKGAVEAYNETIKAILQGMPDYMVPGKNSSATPLEEIWFETLQRQEETNHNE